MSTYGALIFLWWVQEMSDLLHEVGIACWNWMRLKAVQSGDIRS